MDVVLPIYTRVENETGDPESYHRSITEMALPFYRKGLWAHCKSACLCLGLQERSPFVQLALICPA